MASFFFDSNVVVKYYISEPGSSWVRQIVDETENSCLIADISLVEVTSAISQMRQYKSFGRSFVHETISRFQNDVRRGLFLNRSRTVETLKRAVAIAEQHAIKGCDAIQIASAAVAEEITGLEIVFVTGDKQALRAAQLEMLETDDPEIHSSASEDKLNS